MKKDMKKDGITRRKTHFDYPRNSGRMRAFVFFLPACSSANIQPFNNFFITNYSHTNKQPFNNFITNYNNFITNYSHTNTQPFNNFITKYNITIKKRRINTGLLRCARNDQTTQSSNRITMYNYGITAYNNGAANKQLYNYLITIYNNFITTSTQSSNRITMYGANKQPYNYCITTYNDCITTYKNINLK